MLKVIGWIDYDNFNFRTAKGDKEEIEAVAKNIKENGYKFGGDDHENLSNCCPLLSTGEAVRLSWRNWGYVMALAYDLKTKTGDYNYILWYMGEYGPEERKLPPSLDFSTISKDELPMGKDFIYELTKEEMHAINNAAFGELVLPLEYYEQIDLKAFDKVIFKYENKEVLECVVNEIRFIHYKSDEFFEKDKCLDIYPNTNSNFNGFDLEKLNQLFKKKYNLVSDKLIGICLDISVDNRNPADFYVE